jgi:uncharacterized protein
MPTNLPPNYYVVEEQYRKARSAEEKVALLEEMMSIVPKHKGTDHLRADLKRKLAQLRSESRAQKSGAGRQVSAYHIDREGAGQLVLIGLPNVGKSALVRAFTNAEPEVAAHPFTTWTPTPGMMPIDNIQVQLIDTPPLNPEFVKADMIDLIRRADLLLLVVDLQAFPIEQLEDTLAFLEEHRIIPLYRRERYPERFDLTFVPTLVVVNKTDGPALDADYEVLEELLDEPVPLVPVSAETEYHLDTFKQTIFERLEIIRVYAKPPGKDADLSAPFVMRKGGTVEDFAAKVHRDFVDNLKSARIWGHGVFDGQAVSRDHILHDGDLVELRT